MKAWWDRYCDLIDERNERERLLIMLSVLLVLIMAFVTFVYDPMQASHQQVLQRQQQVSQRIATLQQEINQTQQEAAAIQREMGNQRIVELRQSIAHFDRVLHEATVDLMTPQQMADLLQVMLKQHRGLRLIGISSYSEPVELDADIAEENPSETPIFYRHGMRLELEGHFFAVQAYLKSVETSPWNLFWERMDYQVVKTPQAAVMLDIFTLSREAEWLGLGVNQG